MLLPRAIIFTSFVYFSYALHLSKREIVNTTSSTQEASKNVLGNSAKPTGGPQLDDTHIVSSNTPQHVQPKKQIKANFENASAHVELKNANSELEHVANKPDSSLNNVQNASANATELGSNTTSEHSSHRSKREVDPVINASENPIKHATISKNEVTQVHSASDGTTEHVAQAGKVSVNADSVSEKSVVNTDGVSERSSITDNVVSEKSSVNADTVSVKYASNDSAVTKNSALNARSAPEDSALKAGTVTEKTAANSDAVSSKATINTQDLSEKSENTNQASSPVKTNLSPPANGRRSNLQSKWCQNLKNCQSNNIEVCGYDDKAGFAKFKNYCHLMEVNCYWGHDFTLHACKAMQLKQMRRPRDAFDV